MKRRVLSLLLVCCMIWELCPFHAFAAELDIPDSQETQVSAEQEEPALTLPVATPAMEEYLDGGISPMDALQDGVTYAYASDGYVHVEHGMVIGMTQQPEGALTLQLVNRVGTVVSEYDGYTARYFLSSEGDSWYFSGGVSFDSALGIGFYSLKIKTADGTVYPTDWQLQLLPDTALLLEGLEVEGL